MLDCRTSSHHPHRKRAARVLVTMALAAFLLAVFAGTALAVAPTVTSISPTFGLIAGGTMVTINGSGFSGVPMVKFGTTAATNVVLVSPTKLTCKSPAHAAGKVDVTVTTLGGTSSAVGWVNDFMYLARFQEKATQMVYAGTWTSVPSASALDSAYKRSSTANASVVIPFKGTRIDYLATKSPDMGKVDVYLDGVLKKTVDLYSPTSTMHQQRVYSSGLLASGYHTLKLKRAASNLATAFIDIDAVDVGGSLVGPTFYDDTRAAFQPCVSGWFKNTSPNAAGGSYVYTSDYGDVNFLFTGVRVAILVRTGPIYGRAYINIDAGTPVLVDLYSPTVVYKAVWTSGWLSPGQHMVDFSQAYGDKNPDSQGYAISFDGVNVWGVLNN